jgi:hypothetical protein
MKRSFTVEPKGSINKKRGGLSQPLRHRVTNYDHDKGDGYPCINDKAEALLVLSLLVAAFSLAAGMYYLARTI